MMSAVTSSRLVSLRISWRRPGTAGPRRRAGRPVGTGRPAPRRLLRPGPGGRPSPRRTRIGRSGRMPATRSGSAAEASVAMPASGGASQPHAGSATYASTSASSGWPLEAGAMLEGLVEGAQVRRLVGVEDGDEPAHLGAAGQHHGVDLGGVVEQVLLGGERPHAVAHQPERQVRSSHGRVRRGARRRRPTRATRRVPRRRSRWPRSGPTRARRPRARGTRRRSAPAKSGGSELRARPVRAAPARPPSGGLPVTSGRRAVAARRPVSIVAVDFLGTIALLPVDAPRPTVTRSGWLRGPASAAHPCRNVGTSSSTNGCRSDQHDAQQHEAEDPTPRRPLKLDPEQEARVGQGLQEHLHGDHAGGPPHR